MRHLLAVLLATILAACKPEPGYYIETLPSGKQIKVLGVTKMFFAKGDPALILKYQTDLPLDDEPALTKEADEIWPSFRANVEKAGLSSGVISAATPPKGFIVTTSQSYNFVYVKSENGQWSRTRK